jgi:amidophosphoribosyltransferase
MNIGTKLAEKIKQQWLHEEIDVVIPIPETSRHSALSLANHLQIKYREGFIKNRYIGRTFIMPGQSVRQRSVHQKLSVIEMEFKNKNVLLVDDSIVRGTTSQQIIEMARNAGAKKVYFASASPPIRFPNVYGIDMPSSDELIAFNRTVDEVKTQIGADGLIYLDLRDLIESAQNGNPEIKEFEASVFDGKYITGDERDYIARVALLRNDLAKQKEHHYFNECQIDLHNN